MIPLADELKSQHNNANKVLLHWLEHPPVDRRQKRAFELLAEAVQMLNAATINLGIVEIDEE